VSPVAPSKSDGSATSLQQRRGWLPPGGTAKEQKIGKGSFAVSTSFFGSNERPGIVDGAQAALCNPVIGQSGGGTVDL